MAKRKSAKRGSKKPRKSSLPTGYTMFGGKAKATTKDAFVEACEKQGVPGPDRMEAAMQAYIKNPVKVSAAPATPKPAVPKPAAAAPSPAPATPKQETQEAPPKTVFSSPPPKPFSPGPYVPFREPQKPEEKKPSEPSP